MLEIEFIEYSGPVFDLMVEEDESFVVGGIAAHNCSMIPVVRGFPLPGFQTGEQWFSGLSPSQQKKMMGPGRFDAWQNGRFHFRQLVTIADDEIWGPSAQVTSLQSLLSGGGGIERRLTAEELLNR